MDYKGNTQKVEDNATGPEFELEELDLEQLSRIFGGDEIDPRIPSDDCW
jgi:hypothetical protein